MKSIVVKLYSYRQSYYTIQQKKYIQNKDEILTTANNIFVVILYHIQELKKNLNMIINTQQR